MTYIHHEDENYQSNSTSEGAKSPQRNAGQTITSKTPRWLILFCSQIFITTHYLNPQEHENQHV